MYKAVFPSHKPTWQDVAVLKHGPKPVLVLLGPLSGQGLRTHLSVSHDGDHLVAGVIVEKDESTSGCGGASEQA